MTSIWISSGEGWDLLPRTSFTAEATLHGLVEQSPELLPLAGEPQLIVLGREVPLGGGYADLLAIEPSGRLVLIEVKLAANAEARRAVVAQILAYAAFLKGIEPDILEREILRSNLSRREYDSIASAVEQQDREGSFEPDAFAQGLATSLERGHFRLVLVLDEAPPELVRLVGYLESVTPELVIDLVAVAEYDVSGARLLVPQRLDAERPLPKAAVPPVKPAKQGHLIPPEEFEGSINDAPDAAQPSLRHMWSWARNLEQRGLVRLLAYRGTTGRTTLLPYVPGDEAGLITVWNDNNFYVSFWRSVFERHAPAAIERVEAVIAPTRVGQGNTVKEVSDELLAALTAAYEEAAL